MAKGEDLVVRYCI